MSIREVRSTCEDRRPWSPRSDEARWRDPGARSHGDRRLGTRRRRRPGRGHRSLRGRHAGCGPCRGGICGEGAGRGDGADQSRRNGSPGRRPVHVRRTAAACRPAVLRRIGHVAGAGQWRWRQSGGLVSWRRGVLLAQRVAGPQARRGRDRQLRLVGQVRARVGRSLSCAGGHAARRVGAAVDRGAHRREAVGGREPEPDVRQALQHGGGEHAGGRRRQPVPRGHDLGRRRQPGVAVRTEPGHALRGHLHLAGQARLRRTAQMERARTPAPGPARVEGGCSMPRSISVSPCLRG